jgi:hypothetical protein
MDCGTFERWLDQGMPAEDAAAARRHAADCRRCAVSLAEYDAIEALLAAPAAHAPAGFSERVMARISTGPLPVPVAPVAGTVAWWLRAAMDPAAVLALALAALLTWRWDSLWALASAASGAIAGWPVGGPGGSGLPEAVGNVLRMLARPEVALGIDIGVACVLLLATPGIYRATLRRASPGPGRRR